MCGRGAGRKKIAKSGRRVCWPAFGLQIGVALAGLAFGPQIGVALGGPAFGPHIGVVRAGAIVFVGPPLILFWPSLRNSSVFFALFMLFLALGLPTTSTYLPTYLRTYVRTYLPTYLPHLSYIIKSRKTF